MKIKRKSVDGSVERQFLIASILSDQFLKEAISFYDPDLIETKYARTVAEWCFRYFQTYSKAPGLHIKDIFESKSSKMIDSERNLIESLLSGLSEEHERADKMNVPYLLDSSEKHFRLLSLSRLGRMLNGHSSDGDVEEAEAALMNYKRIGRPSSLGENPFKNSETIQRAFESMDKPLFTLPGALGRLMGNVLHRDQFIALMGPEKRGKSWWLNELAIRAAMARCNVALFQIGDMSINQVVVRLGIRLVGKSNQEVYCGEQEVPVPDCQCNQLGQCSKGLMKNAAIFPKWTLGAAHAAYKSGAFKKHKPCSECSKNRYFKGSIWYDKVRIEKPLTWREAWKAGNRLLGRLKGRDFKLSVHPSESLSVSGLKAILDNWETFEGFIPDVIIIDYADNLNPEDGREEKRLQQDRIWKLLRGLSQERHCLVITATQAGASSYDQQSLGMKHFSESKNKYAHVTGTYGLNQTVEEKRMGIMRINPIVVRENEFFGDEEVHVAQAIKMGKPLLFSF